jgi:hypothetical protein
MEKGYRRPLQYDFIKPGRTYSSGSIEYSNDREGGKLTQFFSSPKIYPKIYPFQTKIYPFQRYKTL